MDESKPLPEFTVRDLNRHLATVLEACDRLGGIRIRSRKGRIYELRPETPEPLRAEEEPVDFAARRRAIGMPQMTKEQSERLDRMIRGE